MALFRFTLDGNLLSDEPEGWQDFISELRRDKQIRGQLLLIEPTLFFKEGTDGYAHLKPLIDCQGFCAKSEIQVEEDCNSDGNWVQIVDGLIFYTLVKEHLFPCILECKVKDNSYAAKIDNNKNIEAYVTVGRSKNDEEILAAQSDVVFFFDVVTGNYTGTVRIWPVYACFKFIIHYMTDGEIDFTSDYFYGDLLSGDGRFMTITTGEQIRIGSGGAPTIVPFISFQKLFEEVNKVVKIAFTIETNPISGRKQMRIEPEDYFYDSAVSVTLPNVKGVVKSVNTAELYSRLKIGGETLPFDAGSPSLDFPTQIEFVGFKEESYTLTGICNIDNTLDLVSDWIKDSNIIQAVFSNNNAGYDENIFFVMVDYINADQAIQYDIFSTAPPIFYNGFLRNSEVAQRWLGGIPNSIALYLGPPGTEEFQATKTSTQSLSPVINSPAFEPVIFEDDANPPNFDTGGNYAPLLSEYTIPANGLYTFFTRVVGNTFRSGYTPPTVQFVATLQEYDSAGFAGGNLLNSYPIFDITTVTPAFTNTPYDLSGSVFINGIAGNKVLIALDIFPHQTGPVNVNATIEPGSIFSCPTSETGGGIYQTYDPGDFKAYQYQFNEYPLTFADYQTIIANPLKQLGFNNLFAWIENMKYRPKEGTADFTLTQQLPKTVCE